MLRNGKSKCHFLSVKIKDSYKIKLIYHRPRAKQGLCCCKRTHKPAGVLRVGTRTHSLFPNLLDRRNYSPCYPFPLQRERRNSGRVFGNRETPPTLRTLHYKLLYRFTRLWV